MSIAKFALFGCISEQGTPYRAGAAVRRSLTPVQGREMQDTEKQFAEQDSIQISPDPGKGNGKDDEKNTQKDPGGAVYQTGAVFSKTVENAGKRGIHIKKRTDKSQGADKRSRLRALKQKPPQKRPEKEKAKKAYASQKNTGSQRLSGDMADTFPVSQSLHFRHRGHQKNRGGIRDGRGKKDQRKSHSCKNSVYTERVRGTETGGLKLPGDQDHLNTSKKSEQKTVQRQREGSMENLQKTLPWIADVSQRVFFSGKDCADEKQSCQNYRHLTGKGAACRDRRCDRNLSGSQDDIHQNRRSHPDDLFQKLQSGRDQGVFCGKIIAVDACVQSVQGKTESKDPDQRRCLRRFQKFPGNKNRVAEDQGRYGRGQKKRGSCTAKKQFPGFPAVSQSQLRSDETGKGGLYPGAGYGGGDTLDRKNKLIKAKTLRTNGVGKEYPIEKANDTADNSRAGEDKGPSEKTFFRHFEILSFFVNICRKQP